MDSKFPIVKIDRTTAQEFLPIFMHRGIFSNYHLLPDRDDMLEKRKKELGVEALTLEQEREVLSQAGQYKTPKYVVKDYGDYSIGFSAKMYIDLLEETETEIKGELLKDNYTKAKIKEALQQIKLYKLAHKLAMIILSEAYRQRKYEELVIPKQLILDYLGYCSGEKQIYKEISEAMFSLRWLSYVVHEFTRKVKMHKKSTMTGSFVYNLKEDKKTYTVWINKVFLGCIQHLLTGEKEKRSLEEKKELFNRGYYDYPTRLLATTKNYSATAYMLLNFLIMDSGNSKIKKPGYKVVAYKIDKYMKEARIQHSRPGKRKQILLNALKEVDIIAKTDPTMEELESVKPSRFSDQKLYIFIRRSAEILNQELKSNTEGAKWAKK